MNTSDDLLKEIAIREAEREAVMMLVRRHLHSSQFIRIKAAVDSAAKTRDDALRAGKL